MTKTTQDFWNEWKRLENVEAYLNLLKDKDFATQTTLEQARQLLDDIKTEQDKLKYEGDRLKTDAQLSGSIKALDPDDNPVSLTIEEDNQGRALLRVVQGAQFGYDEGKDVWKTENKGKLWEEILTYSFSVSANSTNHLPAPAREFWVDKYKYIVVFITVTTEADPSHDFFFQIDFRNPGGDWTVNTQQFDIVGDDATELYSGKYEIDTPWIHRMRLRNNHSTDEHSYTLELWGVKN